jgi:hypothetical protein
MIEISYKKLDGTDQRLNIPISWRDLTWNRFVELKGKEFSNEIEKLSWLTGIEYNSLLSSPLFLKAIIESCSFIWDEDIEVYANYISPEHKLNIASLEWGKFEAAKSEVVKSSKNIWSAGEGIIKTYLEIEIGQKPCVEVIGLVSFFLSKLQSLPNDSANLEGMNQTKTK